MSVEDTLPVWKKIYQVVSRDNEHVINGVVDSALEMCEKLTNVLLDYKPYTRESYQEWKKVSKSIFPDEDIMCGFVHRVSRELDLDVRLGWPVICNFLIFDYNGRVDEFKSIVHYEANFKALIDRLWHFHTSERMFALKTLRFILEKQSDECFVHHEKFAHFLSKINLKDLWTNIQKSFDLLLTEIHTDKVYLVSEDILKKWVQRNNREQVELLLLMILVLDVRDAKGDELTSTIKLFLKHGFGRYPLFIGAAPLSRPKDIEDIRNAEIGVILTIAHIYSTEGIPFKILPIPIEAELAQCQLHGDNACVFLIWVVLKSNLNDKFVDYCRSAFEEILTMNVFEQMANCATREIFQGCKAGEIVIDSMFTFIRQASGFSFKDPSRFYSERGVVTILCEFFKRPHLNSLEIMERFFKVGLDMFPYVLDQFLDMAEALLTSEEYYFWIIDLLHYFPTFCTDVEWPFSSDAVNTENAEQLFEDNDKFIIPKGTLLEKCHCFEEGVYVSKFHYQFDFFELVEQYISTLTLRAVNEREFNQGILKLVLRCYKFISFLVKHYRGDFAADTVIKPLLRRLDCVPAYFCKEGFRNFELFYLFFEAKCTLFKYQNVDFDEAFNNILRRMMFPTVTDYERANEDLKLFHSSHECVLYDFLIDEIGLGSHKLLIEYLELILDLIKKEILFREVIYSGIWYIFSLVLPRYRHWNYDSAERFQETKILNICVQIFINVLQWDAYVDIEDPDQKEVHKLVLNTFLYDRPFLDLFAGIFLTDRYYLPNLMHQESNWMEGESLIVVDTVKLQLVVLVVLSKRRAKMREHIMAIDDLIHVFARCASAYFITPYNAVLTVLAGRFLEILARNDNVPLLACLGINYDQVQTLFLERLRDPLEDEEVKLHILNLISTCIFHQTGMTAAFFNIQKQKKWYNPDVKQLGGDTVGDFMIDYLKNIQKSHTYFNSPLQIGILKIMANLWITKRQHLIKSVTDTVDFWFLLMDPLYRPFLQKPLVYTCLLQILAIEYTVTEPQKDKDHEFYQALEKFTCDENQLALFQKYMFKIFLNKDMKKKGVEEREMLVKALSELFLIIDKKFPSRETDYLYVELAFDGLQTPLVHQQCLGTWLDFLFVVINKFGLNFEKQHTEIAKKTREAVKIIAEHYENMQLSTKNVALSVVLKILQELENYYEKSPDAIVDFLEELSSVMDTERSVLGSVYLEQFKADPRAGQELIEPWAVILSITNYLLTSKNCKKLSVWFCNRRVLKNLMDCISYFIGYNESLSVGQTALYGLTLYVQSPLALDFFNFDLSQFFNQFVWTLNQLTSVVHFERSDIQTLKERWETYNLLINFNRAYLAKFKKTGMPTIYAFLTLHEQTLRYILKLPEVTVDLKALNLVTQTLMLYNDVLSIAIDEWFLKSRASYTIMIHIVKRVINSCLFLCLRAKEDLAFYKIDQYGTLVKLEHGTLVSKTFISLVINRLIGILGEGFSCLYKLNFDLPKFFDFFPPGEPHTILIEYDFGVPRFDNPMPVSLTYGKLLSLAHFLCKTLNHLSTENKTIQYSAAFEKQVSKYTVFIERRGAFQERLEQNLSSFLRLYEYSGLSDPWMENLNYKNVQRTTDKLMLFLAQQAYISTVTLKYQQVSYYKRVLSSELQFFNEYIKKHTSELVMKLSKRNQQPHLGDMDYIKRYLLTHWKKNQNGKKQLEKVATENFGIMIYFWFIKICKL